MNTDSLAGRTRRLLDNATYLTMATVSTDGRPWSAVLHYAWLGDPLRLLFGSAVQARHSRHIATRPQVSGALFMTGAATDVAFASVDGAQFTGSCAELTADELRLCHAMFYESVLSDPKVRAEWMLPLSALLPPAKHRLYMITVDRWWLMDTSTWAQDRIERRIEMPLAELATAPEMVAPA